VSQVHAAGLEPIITLRRSVVPGHVWMQSPHWTRAYRRGESRQCAIPGVTEGRPSPTPGLLRIAGEPIVRRPSSINETAFLGGGTCGA
jgi:hypothetical protein